jgi:hypothetical protein
MGVADLAAQQTVEVTAAPRPASIAEGSVSDQHPTAIPRIWRRLLERILRRPLPRRFFASLRWRSGLDADLRELGARLDRLAAALQASRARGEIAGTRVDAEVRGITHPLDQELSALDTARRDVGS